MIDLLGYIATTFTLLSFTVSDVKKLRFINGIGAFLWIFYGFYTDSNPVMLTNAAIVIIHLYKYIKMKDTGSK